MKRLFVLFVLLSLLLVTLAGCGVVAEKEEEPQPEEISAEPEEGTGEEPEDGIPTLYYSEEAITTVDLSRLGMCFDNTTYYNSCLPVSDPESSWGDVRGFSGGTLPVLLAPQNLYGGVAFTRLYKQTEEIRESHYQALEEYVSFLPEGTSGNCSPIAETDDIGQLKRYRCEFPDGVSAAIGGLPRISVLSFSIGFTVSEYSDADLLAALRENPYLAAACDYLGITDPKIFSRYINHDREEGGYIEAYVSDRKEDAASQIRADSFSDLNLVISEEGMTTLLLSVSPEMQVIAEVPCLSYEDAVKNLVSGNALPRGLIGQEVKEEDILAVRMVYYAGIAREADWNNKVYEERIFAPGYEFTIKEDDYTEETPHTYYRFLPACEIYLEEDPSVLITD